MNSVQSISSNCKFIVLLADEMQLLQTEDGMEWSIDRLDFQGLQEFSIASSSFAVDPLEDSGNCFLIFSMRECSPEDFVQIYFARPRMEGIPCAFFNNETKDYENFVIPAGAAMLELSITETHHMEVSWNFDWADEEGIPLDKPFQIQDDITPATEEGTARYQEQIAELKKQLSELEEENQQLRNQSQQSAAIQTQPSPSNDTLLRAENERLRMVVSQLVDREFDDTFAKTLDAQIDEQTQKICLQRKLCDDKRRSLERLNEELETIDQAVRDLTDQINQTIELVQKAESILNESSTKRDVAQKNLDSKLQELGIDVDTLRLYQTENTVDALLQKADAIKEQLEQKLRTLISARQGEVYHRFNRVTS